MPPVPRPRFLVLVSCSGQHAPGPSEAAPQRPAGFLNQGPKSRGCAGLRPWMTSPISWPHVIQGATGRSRVQAQIQFGVGWLVCSGASLGVGPGAGSGSRYLLRMQFTGTLQSRTLALWPVQSSLRPLRQNRQQPTVVPRQVHLALRALHVQVPSFRAPRSAPLS